LITTRGNINDNGLKRFREAGFLTPKKKDQAWHGTTITQSFCSKKMMKIVVFVQKSLQLFGQPVKSNLFLPP
jgi:hypothetical protein